MYTTGFLGSMNMMMTSLTSGMGNWVRAGALALGMSSLSLAGCGGESDTGADSGIPPIDQPDPSDTTVPNTPQGNLDACLPADSSGSRFRVAVSGSGVRLGTGAPIDGGFRMMMPSGAFTPLVLSGNQLTFRGRLKWDSAPTEWATVNPDDAIGPLGLRTQARLSGSPLNNANMTRAGMTGPWANQFPTFVDRNRVSFLWPVEGILHFNRDAAGHVSNCVVEMTIRSAAHTTSGDGPSIDVGVFPFYAPRADGTADRAESDFHNETVVILNEALQVVLPVSGESQAVCEGDCTDINGASNPASIEMRLIRNPVTTSGAGGSGGADAGPGDGGASGG